MFERVGERIGELAAVDPAGLPDPALLDRLKELTVLRDQLDAVIQATVQVVEARQATVAETRLSTTSWLVRECRLARSEAVTRVKTAQRAGLAEAAVAALGRGEIGLAHLRLITTALSDLPVEVRPVAEATLLEAAHQLDPSSLAYLVRRLRDTLDPDGSDEAALRRYDSRHLFVSETYDGMWAVNGMLDQETGALVGLALNALSAPQGSDDSRDAPQRRCDALGELARRAIAAGELPESNGEPVQAVVTVPLATLQARLGSADLAPGGPLTAADARRLACDAALIPVVLGSPSQPLDVGRSTPLWPVSIRRAAAVRDRHCTFPGCTVPLWLCQLHHLLHWADGGPTSLHNSTHLCHRHHRVIHHDDWDVRRDPDGALIFTDPHGTEHRWHPPPTLRDHAHLTLLQPDLVTAT